MADPFTPHELATIRELHEAGKSCRAIATELGRSFSAVSTHARDMGLKFDTAATEAATEKRTTENKAKRAALESRFLDEAAHLLDDLHKPHVVFNFGGRDNTYEEHQFDTPDIAAKRALIAAAGIAVDKAIKLADTDKATTDADTGKSMVGALFLALNNTPVAEDAPEDTETPATDE